MQYNQLDNTIISSLEDIKAQDITLIQIDSMSSVADAMIVCNGNSDRHVKSIANSLITDLKGKGYKIFGHEGLEDGEWVLVDAGDAIVHIMKPEAREYYQLENLWHTAPQEAINAQ